MVLEEGELFTVNEHLPLHASSLLVAWSEDVGKLGIKAINYLNRKLGGLGVGNIEPPGFFPLAGVIVEDNIAQFPESKFYCCPQKNLVSFRSNPPHSNWYKFLDLVLNISQEHFRVRELYTVGGMVYYGSHAVPRQLFAVANSAETRDTLSKYNLVRPMDYETPPGQRPTLSSYLLWIAKRRNIPAVSLWVPIPFYLVSVEDPLACRKALEFLDIRLGLGIDFADLDMEIATQNELIGQVRIRFPEIDGLIRRMEHNLPLTEEEMAQLVKIMKESLENAIPHA